MSIPTTPPPADKLHKITVASPTILTYDEYIASGGTSKYQDTSTVIVVKLSKDGNACYGLIGTNSALIDTSATNGFALYGSLLFTSSYPDGFSNADVEWYWAKTSDLFS